MCCRIPLLPFSTAHERVSLIAHSSHICKGNSGECSLPSQVDTSQNYYNSIVKEKKRYIDIYPNKTRNSTRQWGYQNGRSIKRVAVCVYMSIWDLVASGPYRSSVPSVWLKGRMEMPLCWPFSEGERASLTRAHPSGSLAYG